MRSLVGAAMDEEEDAPKPAKRRAKSASARSKPRISRGKKVADEGYVARWLDSFEQSARWGLRWSFAIFFFFVVVAVTGLFSGGHVSAALASLKAGADKMMFDAGFKVENVTLDGRAETTPGEIVRMLGIRRGDLMLYVDAGEAKARLEALPWVKSAEISRIWPNRIVVKITERKPVALWQLNGKTTVIDAEGHTIDGEEAARFSELPLVVGPGAGEATASLLSLFAAQPNFKLRVKAAVRVGERRWNLQLANGVEVRLPEEGAEAALSELIRLDLKSGLLGREIKAIDLRFSDRVIVKLPPGSPLIQPVRTSGRET